MSDHHGRIEAHLRKESRESGPCGVLAGRSFEARACQAYTPAKEVQAHHSDRSRMREESEMLQSYGAVEKKKRQLTYYCDRHVVHFVGTYPDTTTALTRSVLELFGDDSNWDVVLQQCERGDEPRWPSTSLMNSVSVLSVTSSVKGLTTSTGRLGVMVVPRNERFPVYDVAQAAD